MTGLLPLIFVSGVLGSAHCIGMCGPFALTLGSSATGWRQNLVRQLVYSIGRIVTYAFLGAVGGFAGMRLGAYAQRLANVPAILAVGAGVLLVYQGLLAAGVIGRRTATATTVPCLGGSMLATFLRGPDWKHVFLAGLFTGMLPCGLVYGFLALAASSANMLQGTAIMTLFGLGTIPVMVATGFGTSLLRGNMRNYLYRLAAWSVTVAGTLSILRGIGFLGSTPSGCPLCW